MKNRKGMVYTTFAIIATSLLILLFAFTSSSEQYTSDEKPFRIGEASYYLANVESDLKRAHYISTQNAASGIINYTVRTGEPVMNLDQSLNKVTLNGSTERFNNVVPNSSLNSWEKSVKESAQDSGYDVNIDFEELEFKDQQIQLKTKVKASTQLKDTSTSTQFNNTIQRTNTVDLEGFEDTLIFIRSADTYLNEYKNCGFKNPLKEVTTGERSNSGATYGKATTDISTTDKEEKILITENSPDRSDANQFAGVVSTAENNQGYSDVKYVFQVPESGYNDIEEGQNLILYEDQIWHSRVREVINTGCYMQSKFEDESHTVGPGIKERIKDETTSRTEETQGLETILDKSRLPEALQEPERSNVGYHYFRGRDGEGIAGITGEEAFDSNRDVYREDFRLDQDHIEEWGIEALAY